MGHVDLKDKLGAFGDTQAYLNSNPSKSKVRLRLGGGIPGFICPNSMAVTLLKGDSKVIVQWKDTFVDSLTRNISICSWIAVVSPLVYLKLKGDRELPLQSKGKLLN